MGVGAAAAASQPALFLFCGAINSYFEYSSILRTPRQARDQPVSENFDIYYTQDFLLIQTVTGLLPCDPL